MPKKYTPEEAFLPVLEPSLETQWQKKPVVETNSENATITLRSLFPAKIKYVGRVSGKSYTWDEAGSVVAVAREDAPHLLSKKIGSSGCCGAHGDGNTLFEQI